LELVLALPLLLLVLALMINFGHIAAWKARTLQVARMAEWRQRPTRQPLRYPGPAEWPTERTTFTVEPGPAPALFNADPYARHLVVRGPVLTNPQVGLPGSQLSVDTTMLDMPGTLKQGRAAISRELPLLGRLYEINQDVVHLMLEDEWRFFELGYSDNQSRRALLLYGFTPPAHVQERAAAFRDAALAILNAPFRGDLAVLDRDAELAAWYGTAPDFHPRLGRACTLEAQAVRAGPVQELIDRIQGPRGGGRGGVPERVARSFLNMYQAQLNLLQNQQPPPTAQIQQLQQKIQQLQGFLGSLN
jgi:hypothetical protein